MEFDFFDAHSHLNLKPLKKDADEIIKILEKENIGTITVGADFETSKEAVELSKKSSNLFAGVGLHPTDNHKEKFNPEAYKKLALNSKVVCIGECGLDYFRLENGSEKEKEKQKEVFKKHIELSLELDLPLMLHIRSSAGSMDAYKDALEILSTHYSLSTTHSPGNAHFFAGNIDTVKRFLNLGFTISFAGPITFTRDYDEIVKYIPLDMILAETDAPFAAPEPYRGKTNMPQYVREVVKKIAEIRNEELEKVQKTLVENTLRLFNI